jgi:hypothetical protein
MDLPLRIVSTDFDGTLFAEFENPPVPRRVQKVIGELQQGGVCWIINTGRDMSSLMEALGRSHLPIEPDFLVLVEREIFVHEDSRYVGLTEWNDRCHRSHEEVFGRLRADVGDLAAWVKDHFHATIYEDAFSPFCLIAGSNGDADAIHAHLDDYCRRVPKLVVVRNDVYMRFSHADFNKGTALAEISRRLGVSADGVFAAGDHLNDLPMLQPRHARWLAAPVNAIPEVKAAVQRHGGHVSTLPHGEGVAEALELLRKRLAA